MFRTKPFTIQLAAWLAAIAFVVQPCLAGPCTCGPLSKQNAANDSHCKSQPEQKNTCCCCSSGQADSAHAARTCCRCGAVKQHRKQADNSSVCSCNMRNAPAQPVPVPAPGGVSHAAEKSLQPSAAVPVDLQNHQIEFQIRSAAAVSPGLFLSAAQHCISLCRLRF